MPRQIWLLRLPLIAVMGFSIFGCSGSGDDLPREPVSGLVTLDGEPLPAGTIQFSSDGVAGGGVAVGGGSQIKDGNFSISQEFGLVPAKYKVAIYSAGKRVTVKSEEPGKRGSFSPEVIPAKYNAKSTLTAEVKKGGVSDLKFELQSK